MHLLSLGWCSVGRISNAPTFFSCLDTRKEGKRKSRPLPRPGKLAGCVWGLENVVILAAPSKIGPQNVLLLSTVRVGAYRIRPPDVPFMERITLKMDAFGAFAILGDGVWRAYAIRPYRDTSKRIKFRCSYLKWISQLVVAAG